MYVKLVYVEKTQKTISTSSINKHNLNSLTKTGIIYNDSFPPSLIFIISLIDNFNSSVC